MKKNYLLFTILFSSILLCGCSNLNYFDDTKKEEPYIILSETAHTLEVGETYKINYVVFNSTEKPTFSSANANIASVDSEGNVTGLSLGEVGINIDLGDAHYLCEIEVIAAKQYYIFLNNDSIVLEVGGTFEVNPVLMKTSSDIINDATYTYTSKNTSVFTVNNNIVTGVASGESTLLITTTYNNIDYYKVLNVTVL